MPQTLARIPIHLVFSTKDRVPFLTDLVRDPLHRQISGALQHLKSPALHMNSVDDHIHILFELGRTVSVSEVAQKVKQASSKWIKTQGSSFSSFAWQAGYGAFGVSESHIPMVADYISRQQEHHRKTSFQDEYRALLHEHGVEFDEKYVWD